MSKKSKIQGEIDENGRVVFWKNDKDGLTAQDSVVIASGIVFFGGIAIGLFITILGMFTGHELPDKFIDLIKTMDLTMSVVLGGLFAHKTAQSYFERDNKKEKKQDTFEGDDI